MAALDPFVLEYDAIVRVLREHSQNKYRIIDWNSTRAPQPDLVASSDLPEWQLRPTNMTPRLGDRSCASVVTSIYALSFNTGDYVLGKYLLPGNWALMRAFYALQYGALDNLKYNDRAFVEDVQITGVTQGTVDPDNLRRIVGWSALWQIQVVSSFSESDLTG